MPKVSVVIPAWNEEKYLEHCLSDLEKQTFKDFEIIVVDNNSTDATAEVAKRFHARVVFEPKKGITPARERGFKEAQADIIARTDADSRVAPDWVEQIYTIMSTHPHVVALSGSLQSPHWAVPNPFYRIVGWFYRLFTLALIGHPILYGPNMALRKSAWEKVHVCMDDSLVHEDIDLSCHVAPLGDIIYAPQVRTTYSLRRVKTKPFSQPFEYFIRYLRTIFIHNPRFLHPEDWRK